MPRSRTNEVRPRPAVLLIGNHLSAVRGARSVGEDLAERLAQRGWRVALTSEKPNRLLRLLDMVLTVWRRRREYEVAQVDVYSGNAFRWAEIVCWLLRRLRKPFVLTLHGGNLPAFARTHPGRVRKLLQSANAVTTPSRYLKEGMRQYRTAVELVPNPIDLKGFRFRLRKKPEPRLVWVRAFHRIYNPSLAPQVVARLISSKPETRLAMIGRDQKDGSMEEAIALAGELGVTHHVAFVGGVRKTEIPDKLDQADIFLNTTNVDNTPLSVIEAMAAGLCVVSTDVGGIRYLLDDGKDALLVPPDDPAAMASAVERLLSQPGLAESLSRHGREKVTGFDWANVIPVWEKLLSTLVAEKG